MISKPSYSNKENSDKLQLSRAQSYRRRKSTTNILKDVHCNPRSTDATPIMNGMWSTIVNDNSPKFVESLIGSSKVCNDKIIPNIVKKKVQEFEKSEENFIRSTALLYKGGILTKMKYKQMRKKKVSFMTDVAVPRPIAYDRLMSYINGLNMGDVLDLEVQREMIIY